MLRLFVLLSGVVVAATVATVLFMRSTPSATSSSWNAPTTLFAPPQSSALPSVQEPLPPREGRESLGLIPLPVQEGATEKFATDLVDLLAALTQPAIVKNETDPTEPSAYAFIPQGLLTIDTKRPLTPEQQALHDYGDILGSSLATFADLHPNMPQILKDQAEDRTNPTKISALKRLANDFTQLGNEIASIQDVPQSASSAHEQLVAAYRSVGEKLALIPDATTDQAFLDAVNAYNPAAENLSRRLVAFVDLFSARGVTFSQSDPGNVFTFSFSSSF